MNWVVHGLIYAEELGVTSGNVSQFAQSPPSTAVARLLGVSFGGGEVANLGFAVDPQFLQRAIAAVGNYGEIYDRTIVPVGIDRACTLNALYTEDKSGCRPGKAGGIPLRMSLPLAHASRTCPTPSAKGERPTAGVPPLMIGSLGLPWFGVFHGPRW